MHSLNFLDITSFVSLLVLTLLHVGFVSATHLPCYYPDGSIPTDYLWEPCTGAKYSSCCVPSEGDVCQEDGLCYYPDEEIVYRGTCTDQTWMDPACNVNKCVSGFETTWQWVGECISSDTTSTVCGSMSDSSHVTPTCAGNAVLNTAYVTTTSTSSAHIYTAPPSIDTARFSIETDSYTTTITANAQSTTVTSTFESTRTSTLSRASGGESAVTVSTAVATSTAAQTSIASGDATKQKKTVTMSIGTLVAIGVGVLVAILIGLAIIFYVRHKKQVFKKSEAIKLDNTNFPPPNGPVGDDQIYPYEAPVNEVMSPTKKHMYASPRLDTYEMDDRTAIMREKRDNGVVEMHTDEGGLRSPAPAYYESIMPAELDGTSSFHSVSGR